MNIWIKYITGWFKLYPVKYLKFESPRRFLEVDPEILPTTRVL